MQISNKELNALVKEFKELVELDVVGINVSDARNTIHDWLFNIGLNERADEFESKVYDYQNSKKIQKKQEKYNNQY